MIEVPQFRNGRLLADHYAKHARGVVVKRNNSGVIKKELAKPGGPDLPEFKSLAEYRTAAQQMWTRSPGGSIVERTLGNGDRVRWNWDDGTFGVLSKDGYIRTFFRPDKGYDYFLEALD